MQTLIIFGTILIVLGIVGSILPAVPGPVLGYIGLIFLFFAKSGAVSVLVLVLFGITMLLLVLLDYLAPILGAKFSGASKKGLVGSIVGSLVGLLLLPPLGVFIGALVGAYLGEVADGKKSEQAFKAGIGTLFGSLAVIVLQTLFALSIAIYFIVKLF